MGAPGRRERELLIGRRERELLICVVLLAIGVPPASAFSLVMAEPPKPKIVVCGAGVIGCSIAYHLSLRDAPVTLIDRSGGVAPAASGKAGGFLALDWNDQGSVGPLSRLSFKMHEELAQKLKLDSYRRLTCSHIVLDSNGLALGERKSFDGAEWVDKGVRRTSVMGTRETIAQVHPKQLTEALFKEAQARGCEFKAGRVERIELEDRNGKATVVGVRVDGKVEPCDVCVIAMGPWSATAAQGLDLPPIFGQKYHVRYPIMHVQYLLLACRRACVRVMTRVAIFAVACVAVACVGIVGLATMTCRTETEDRDLFRRGRGLYYCILRIMISDEWDTLGRNEYALADKLYRHKERTKTNRYKDRTKAPPKTLTACEHTCSRC